MIRAGTVRTHAVCVATLVAILGVDCGRQPQRQGENAEQRTEEAGGQAIEQRIGWLHGACLAIDNKTLAAGAPLTMMVLDNGQSIVEGNIVRPADAAARCPALAEGRRAANTETGLSFYVVAVPQDREPGLAIGVIGKAPRVGTGLDANGDGKADQFSQCATTEGVSFAVWNGPAYQGAPLWSGYYYLGYDTDSTCPS
jgi:hypothetical protein